MSELKKCPFCGAEAELIEFYITGSANTKHFFVRCKKCRARRGLNSFSHPQIARNEWNTRTDGWIKFDGWDSQDRLPEDRDWVLVFHTGYGTPKKAKFKEDSCSFWIDGDFGNDGEVTHWQPLPEPPKGD